ncbi:D-serine deaminase-like pyridoxal phosphate-dependent protein [Nitrospirillum amazonense]|uniref:D-serine deaminase-like pyridoxal phosphate-dependent protein n=1 Tax=Nitrospirillum amazonense TaxID=28077 RepID=A0A560F9Q5_9PROT|nr:alanine racemase [Nitrospirillum amazonense]TWB18356.1 D-serine deaminase-like pyridoxal phosphate-dependent protein [Nitrospirillum amazonense]TWB66123.1 D-serine deaminase-like pyridoxal phosphate-dependent protein [Nitrospirillum amazonense]
MAIRPHAKTHKCVEIARRQLAAGAIGLCCAKLGEAETFVRHGMGYLLLTSPIVTAAGIQRLMGLIRTAPETMVVVDDARNVMDLAAAATASGVRLRVLVDLDVGLNRTGVASVEEGVALARLAHEAASLDFRGMQAYAGHAMHIVGREARHTELTRAAELTWRLRRALTAAGLIPAIVTGGGTGSADADVAAGVLTELQVGSYILMDREYQDVWQDAGERPPFDCALFLQTTVISANRPGQCTTDAGCKAFATDAGAPRIVAGAPPDARYDFFGDEQGRVTFARTEDRLSPGAVLTCMTPHCDPYGKPARYIACGAGRPVGRHLAP